MKKIIAIILSVALSCALCTTVSATTGTTQVQLQLSDTQIDATVPLQIIGTVGGDGALTFPTTTKIVNESIFPIHVSGIVCAAETGWVLAETDGGMDNTIVATIKGNSQTTGYPLIATEQTTDTNWNMDASGGGATSEVALTFAGNVYKLTTPLTTTPANVFTITFTLATGSNQ